MTCSKGRPLLAWATGASACVLVLLGAGGALQPGVAQAQEAASAVQDVTLQDVTLTFGDTVLKAPRLTASGTRLSKDELTALLKPGPGESWASRLVRLDAASLAMPELRVERTGAAGATPVVTYRDVVARDVRAGRVAELTAAGASILLEGGPQKGTGTYGRMRATDLDLTVLARLYGEPGDGKSALQRIYATFAVDDIAYVDARGTAVKIARIEGRDLSGRQIPATWTGALQAFTAVDYERLAPPERSRLMSLGADLAEAVSVGSLEATGLSVQEAKPRDAFSLGIARLGMTGAGLLLEDIAFAGVDGAKARLARLSLDGFSLGPTVAALRKLSALTAPPSDSELRLLTPAFGTLALKDLSLDLPAEAKAPRDPADKAVPGPTHVGLRDGSMNFAPPRDGVPTAGRLSLSGLTLPASAVAGVPGLGSLGLYGYSDLDLALVADTSWDEAARELKLGEVSVSGKDMGSLRINGMIGGIGPEVFNPDMAVSSFAMLSATAKALDLTIENTGLFDRFIAAQSKVLSLKPEELKQEYVTASVFGVPAILGNSVGAKAIGAAMGQFVTKPGTLSVSLRPKNAAGIGMLEFSAAPTPAALFDRLEVNAKAN
ncbi:hypothetical protein ASF49_17050 [Methylobacterium sp. Leaf104]|uniref:hypothetical protein n=1 Tax=Methylobacterium TaxID=407 RepID=UPI0006F8145C|nr:MULTISPECIES: hypothetical protein [Methylobacterium]KQP41477.1 hypothetical protein ASF49_17050 [Methylobacterium sp. Leaf104]MCI9881537.1 hypothetical protein [Methylobacterium goesingense]